MSLIKKIFPRKFKFLLKRLFGISPGKVNMRLVTVKFGNSNYGAWSIYPKGLTENSIIYSFGIGEDINFELSLFKKYGCKIYCFDPTPKSINYIKNQNLPTEILFYKYGISNKDGLEKFYMPLNEKNVSHSLVHKGEVKFIEVEMKRLKTIMNQNNHMGIDILKMDIEGAEYFVLEDILREKLNVKQILLEFHHFLPGISLKNTRNTIKMLKTAGYALFHVSMSGYDYSFFNTISN